MTPDRTRARGRPTGGQARAVNLLLEHLGVRSRHGGVRRAHEAYPAVAVRQAAELLADTANNTLMAGIDGQDVVDAWPQVAVVLEAMQPEVCGARHPSDPRIRCLQRMAEHPATWHQAADDDGREVVWAVDAVRPGAAGRRRRRGADR
jgi:hypothetical protein